MAPPRSRSPARRAWSIRSPSGEVARLVVEDGAPLLPRALTEEAVARAGPFPPPPTGLGVLRIPVRYRLTD